MRTFELRVYTMFYIDTIYPRHFHTFPLFGVEAHGLWTAKEDAAPRAFVLVSYAEGDDPREIARRYLKSPELANDVRDFAVADIVGVESTILVPSASSPKTHRSNE